jgi:mono/diheme cytochrome c family protein
MRNATFRAGLSLLIVGLAASIYLHAAPAPAARTGDARRGAAVSRSPAPITQPTRALVDKYCITCHSERLKTGNLVLEGRDMSHVAADAEVWEAVIKKLRAGAMPPANVQKRPDKAEAAEFVAQLESTLDHDAAEHPNPGRSGVHRLNRNEYAHAIRDLLGLEVEGRDLLPPDDAGYGFDNIADALTVSPALLERYLIAAQKIARVAVGDSTLRTAAVTYALPFSELQEDRASEDLPFGSRGGIAVRHYFPFDGEYAMQIRLQRSAANLGGGIRGLDVVNDIDVHLDGVKIKTFTLGGGKAEQDGDLRGPYAETELERLADDQLKLRTSVKAGTHLVGISLRRGMWEFEGVGMSRLPLTGYGYSSARKSGPELGKVEMGIDSVEIRGPFEGETSESESRRKIFVCHPAKPAEEAPCARRILSTLARYAYRRPVTGGEIDKLLAIYAKGRQDGTFDIGIEWALERLLVDPSFLFRVEHDPAGVGHDVPYRLTDLELASRLSFFLWSSIPDDELLTVAARGRLKDPVVLEQQTRRMLSDPKADALIKGFFEQWLSLRNIPNMKPNLQHFPDFDEGLRRSFQQETDLFLESQIRENHSILDLFTANYTFVNERLARFYGIPNIYGNHFRRVTLPDDRRAGLLGQGSILLVTSYADRTSPVQRGKWLLINVLGTPPADPPPNVPAFPENTGAQPRSVRERLEQHRKNPVCASCHAQMDPLGFALENFDAIGKWRSMDERTPINASGTMTGGLTFNGPAEFRAALLKQSDLILTNVISKFLTYALGRGVEAYDMPVVRELKAEAAAADDRWSALVLGIAKSAPFQMRRSQ